MIKIIKPLILSALLPFTLSCFSQNPYLIKKIDDEFDGFKIRRMVANTTPNDLLESFNIDFNVQRFTDANGKHKYNIIIVLYAHDWLFIQEGKSLTILADNEKLLFSGKGSSNNRNAYGGTVIEKAFYDCTTDNIIKIAYSKNVKFRVMGSNSFIKRELSIQNKENLQKFIDEYIR